jgi:hypothetical protein
MASDLRRVKNVGDTDLVDAFDGTHYWIAPGGEAMVPADAVDLWFGDHSAIDKPYRKERESERERLKVRYGAYHRAEDWEANQPRVEVYDLEGQLQETVLSDPKGDKITEASSTVDEQRQLYSLIQAQQAELEQLRSDFRSNARQQEALESGIVEEDTPTPVPSRRAQRAGK